MSDMAPVIETRTRGKLTRAGDGVATLKGARVGLLESRLSGELGELVGRILAMTGLPLVVSLRILPIVLLRTHYGWVWFVRVAALVALLPREIMVVFHACQDLSAEQFRHHPMDYGVVRRRIRADRNRLGRHVPRPRKHGREARQRRPAVPVPRARHLGRAGRVVAARRARRGRPAWPEGVQEATKTDFAGGWFHTGDIGVVDDDGYLYIVDRLKDMIVSGGENIASSEIERVLYEHASVVEVAVVGRPDDRWGEVPVAFVVLQPDATATPDELIEHCRGQLAKFKVPNDVVFIDELPRNPSGKVLKRDLRSQA